MVNRPARAALALAVFAIATHMLTIFGSFIFPFDRLILGFLLAVALLVVIATEDLAPGRVSGATVIGLAAIGFLMLFLIGAGTADFTGFFGFNVPDTLLIYFEMIVLVMLAIVAAWGASATQLGQSSHPRSEQP